MPLYLNTRGKSDIAIGCCDRCHLKMAHADMVPDPNTPGIRGHKHCMDQYDPWRLPARQPDKIDIEYPRPDTDISV